VIAQQLKLALAPLFYRMLAPTIRIEPPGVSLPPEPVIYACLHRDLIPALLHVRPARPSVMVSNSPDGDILIRILERDGFTFVRGSTGDGGGRAFLRQLELLRGGVSAGIAVDGPRGPFGTVHEGVIQLSRRSGAPIIPLRFEPGPNIELRTWDRTMLPAPLRRIKASAGEPLRVPAELSPAESARWRDRLTRELVGPDGPPPRVLDRRPDIIRRGMAAWKRWEQSSPRWLAAARELTSPLVSSALRRRLASRPQPALRPFVVSIGNLAVGGTGKTPVTLDLAAALGGMGLRGAVVTRGYGSDGGARLVDPADPVAGDEARMLAARLPRWLVAQGPRRCEAVALALESDPELDVIILEDGHQTAGVARHLDVLILDRWDVVDGSVIPRTGNLLPWGPYREGASGAGRAAVWLLPDAEPEIDAGGGRQLLGFAREPVLPDPAALADGASYGVISGIAHPERFEADCARLSGRPPVLSVRCGDHARYDRPLIKSVLAQGRRDGVAVWLTTAKDWVKLKPIWPESIPVAVVELELRWSGKRTLADLVFERFESHRAALGSGKER